MSIEISPSNRASCRACKTKIDKGALRFGESFASEFFDGDRTFYYHLHCAAQKRPEVLKEAIDAYPGEIPDRKALIASLGDATKDVKLDEILRAELAPTGQATCIVCKKAIEKSSMRLAIEIDAEPAMKSTSFIHLGCGKTWTQDHPGLPAKLEILFRILPNTNCPSCLKGPLSYLDPAKHKVGVEQLACAKCGGMFDLAAIDTRKKNKKAPPKKKAKAKAKAKKKKAVVATKKKTTAKTTAKKKARR